MPRDEGCDVLFQPVKIDPVTEPNRRYQMPRCSGMIYQLLATLGVMLGLKAESG